MQKYFEVLTTFDNTNKFMSNSFLYLTAATFVMNQILGIQ